jgi:hypothetical protein
VISYSVISNFDNPISGWQPVKVKSQRAFNSRRYVFASVHFEITGTMFFSVKRTRTVVHDVQLGKIVVLCSIPVTEE